MVITGFLVDPHAMSISLDADYLHDLVSAVRAFVSGYSDSVEGRRRKLRDWLHIIGWMSWSLTVCPLLRPAFSSAYRKISGKNFPNAGVFVNAEVNHDFPWFADAFKSFSGVRILRSLAWSSGEADLQIYCDASPSGLGF